MNISKAGNFSRPTRSFADVMYGWSPNPAAEMMKKISILQLEILQTPAGLGNLDT